MDNTNQTDKAVKKGRLVVPDKTTLNLCMKEKTAISPALFVPILLLILVLALVIGYFGVYKPYQSVKDRQAELDAARAKLQQTYDRSDAYDNKYKDEDGNGGIVKEYNRYNYEGFDDTIANRLDVLALVEKYIFPVASVRSIDVSDKTVTLVLTGIGPKEVSELIIRLSEEELVAAVPEVWVMDTPTEDGTTETRLNMTIKLNDASKGGD